jgi:homoserine O-acetyltransferase/O-succinyltransferase
MSTTIQLKSISPYASQYESTGTLHGIQYFHSDEPTTLECGFVLPSITVAYHTFGTLNSDRSNVVWIIHALTANSDPSDWWSGIVGDGKAIDPSEHFIVCANSLGSPYGSTSPLSIDPTTGEPYYHDFPVITQRDVAKVFDRLRLYLGLDKIQLVVGASLGGQQCLEWSIMRPEVFDNQLLIATNAMHSPWGIAFNESQRMAIYADQTWLDRNERAGSHGLKAARAMALLSYRSYEGYGITQREKLHNQIDDFRASSYQNYQGEKLVKRFNAFSYVSLSKAMDSHHIGRGRGRIEEVLAAIRVKTTIIGIDSDVLFPVSEQSFLYSHIPRSKFYTISSPFGHDGFLTENDTVSRIIGKVIRK